MTSPASPRFFSARFVSRGFTLVELLVATTLLAFATFGVLSLLRLSDQMAYRARVDARVSDLVRTRVGQFVQMPFWQLRSLMAGYAPDSGNLYIFQRGVVPVSAANPTAGFPFAEEAESQEGAYGSPKYLLRGKPLPGETGDRGLFPYQEVVGLDFGQAVGTARSAVVTYQLVWEDQVAGTNKTMTFTFSKYDPLFY